VLFAAKILPALYILDEDERDLQHFSSLFIYILSTELAALAGYQFVFFSFCAKHRYAALVGHAKGQLIDFEYGKCVAFTERNIEVVEELALLHSQMSEVFHTINETFSNQVRSGNVLKLSQSSY
jgi:hypothetical protein